MRGRRDYDHTHAAAAIRTEPRSHLGRVHAPPRPTCVLNRGETGDAKETRDRPPPKKNNGVCEMWKNTRGGKLLFFCFCFWNRVMQKENGGVRHAENPTPPQKKVAEVTMSTRSHHAGQRVCKYSPPVLSIGYVGGKSTSSSYSGFPAKSCTRGSVSCSRSRAIRS